MNPLLEFIFVGNTLQASIFIINVAISIILVKEEEFLINMCNIVLFSGGCLLFINPALGLIVIAADLLIVILINLCLRQEHVAAAGEFIQNIADKWARAAQIIIPAVAGLLLIPAMPAILILTPVALLIIIGRGRK